MSSCWSSNIKFSDTLVFSFTICLIRPPVLTPALISSLTVNTSPGWIYSTWLSVLKETVSSSKLDVAKIHLPNLRAWSLDVHPTADTSFSFSPNLNIPSGSSIYSYLGRYPSSLSLYATLTAVNLASLDTPA